MPARTRDPEGALEAEKSGMATRSGHPLNLSAHWRARSKGKPQAALRLSGGLRPPRRCGPRPQDARSASDSDAGEEGRSALPAPPLDRFDRACSVHRNGGRTAPALVALAGRHRHGSAGLDRANEAGLDREPW